MTKFKFCCLIFFAFFMMAAGPTFAAVSTNVYYDAALDEYLYEFNDSGLSKIESTYFFPSGAQGDTLASTLSGSGTNQKLHLTCNGSYQIKLYSGSTLAHSETVTTTEIVSTNCAADPGNPNSGGTLCPECSRLDSLIAVSNRIAASIDSNGNTLKSILGEMKTDVLVSNGSVPSFLPPSSSGRIERNKPVEKPVFEDTTNYFVDAGDAPIPDEMPTVPDVEPCWGSICKEADNAADAPLVKENELVKDTERNKDNELLSDGELTKDNFVQTPELVKDGFSQDAELTKDTYTKTPELTADTYLKTPELVPDVFSQTPEMIPDSYSQTENYSNTDSYGQTHFYNQTEIYDVTH